MRCEWKACDVAKVLDLIPSLSKYQYLMEGDPARRARFVELARAFVAALNLELF